MKKIISLSFLMSFVISISNAQVSDTLPCPLIQLTGSLNYKINSHDTVIVSVKQFPQKYDTKSLLYAWTISRSTILQGQGTDKIYVSTSDLKGENITATVEIVGLKQSCPSTKSIVIRASKSKPVVVKKSPVVKKSNKSPIKKN